jgi:hypothetical protein
LRKVSWARREIRYIEHCLAVSDTVSGIAAACRRDGRVQFIEQEDIMSRWAGTERQGKRSPLSWRVQIPDHGAGDMRAIDVIPDELFGLEFSGAAEDRQYLFFFLEQDRDTMPEFRHGYERTSIYRKLRSYAESRASGLYRELFGIRNPRVLTVVPGPDRIDRILAMANDCLRHERGYRANGYFFATTGDMADSATLLDALIVNGYGELVTLRALVG